MTSGCTHEAALPRIPHRPRPQHVDDLEGDAGGPAAGHPGSALERDMKVGKPVQGKLVLICGGEVLVELVRALPAPAGVRRWGAISATTGY